jgi:hypothetical protein
MSKWRWQDYLSVLIGVWIASSPWVFGFVDARSTATWNAVVLGLAIAVIAAVDLEILSKIEEWVLVTLGAWSIVSPWALGFTNLRETTASMVISGVAVIVLTLWEIVSATGWHWPRNHSHG